MWSVPRDWPGETVFIVAGGPSFTLDHAARLRGRRVIAINSAWHTTPSADLLFFGDARWWNGNCRAGTWPDCGRNTTSGFKGLIVTCADTVHDDRVLKLRKEAPPKWTPDPSKVTMNWSSVTAAMNIADHAGAARIVLCGLDGKVGPAGKRHHHGARYPWPLKPDSFDRHAEEFASVAPAIARRGIAVFIANPDSRHDCWPRLSLEDVL